MSSDQSPISVVAALRISSKGKLRYDRHWAERDVSKERVLKEVTDIKEANLVSDVTCNEPDKREDNARSPTIPATSVSNSGGTVGRRSRRDPLVVISPLNRSGLDKSTLQSPVIRSPVTPVSVTIKRSEERDVVDPRNVVMSGQKPESPANSSLNYSLNLSRSLALEESNNSVLSYDTPDVIKYHKYPRVDLQKIRIPDSLLAGDISTEEENESLDVLDISSQLDEGNGKTSPDKSFKGQSSVEEQLMLEMQKRMEDAGRRVEKRSAEWEAKRKQEENACKEKLESLKESFRVEKEKLFSREVRDLEDMVGQMIIIQQQERESKQQELIFQARKEEQLAKEKLERKKRMGEQMEKFAPLQNKITENLQKVLQVWNSIDDKNLFSPSLVQTVPQISQISRSLLEDGRNQVVKGECSDGTLDQLNTLNNNLLETSKKIEEDKTRIENEKVAEEEKAKQLLLKEQEEEALKATQAQAAAASQQPVTETQQPQQQATQPPAVSSPSQPPVPAQVSAQPPQPLGQINDSVSPENKAWYDSIVQFKSDFIKNVVFTDSEKQFKFDLQRAVNTPLNSLSGVSSAHLQDKVDKLVQLLSGAQVTVGERTVSVTQHQHARSFCLGLAAKKLAKQGEDVVSSDSKSAFPAATFALAIWDKFPEFGTLLLAYMFEMCPFLVPFHPLQTAGQTDKEHYVQLGYKYDGDTIEKQDKYLKRMSGLARLYAALSVSHLPKASSSVSHPHPPARVWTWFSSVLNLTPHTDITASLILDILEVTGNTMFAKYGKQFGKLLQLVKSKYFPKLEAVKSEGGPTVRLDQFLNTAIRGQSIREPDGCLKPGFL